jgi:hypothetical protein
MSHVDCVGESPHCPLHLVSLESALQEANDGEAGAHAQNPQGPLNACAELRPHRVQLQFDEDM